MPRIRRAISEKVPEPPPQRWSNCLVVGEQVFIAGQVARGPDGKIAGVGDMYEQARICFDRIASLMEAAGGVMGDVVKLNIYVTDMSRNAEVWRARAERFKGDFPTSTLVQVAALGTPEIMVEIEAIGFVGAAG